MVKSSMIAWIDTQAAKRQVLTAAGYETAVFEQGLEGKNGKNRHLKLRKRLLAGKGEEIRIIAARHASEREKREIVASERLREWYRQKEAQERASPNGRVGADFPRAARVVRPMGYRVEPSKDRHGRFSSCCNSKPGFRDRIRMSDHDIPETPERASNTEFRGHSLNGSANICASDASIRRPEWWRRATMLAMAGRDIPGAES